MPLLLAPFFKRSTRDVRSVRGLWLLATTDARKDDTQEQKTSSSGKRDDGDEQLVAALTSLFELVFERIRVS
jgi:hypothetical protein